MIAILPKTMLASAASMPTVNSFPLRLPEPPAFTWTNHQWVSIVARQTLTENRLHFPAQASIDKLVDIMTHDSRYELPWGIKTLFFTGSLVTVFFLYSVSLMGHYGIGNPWIAIGNVWLTNEPMKDVAIVLAGAFGLYRTASTAQLNVEFKDQTRLSITSTEWGEEMPNPQQVDEDSMPLP